MLPPKHPLSNLCSSFQPRACQPPPQPHTDPPFCSAGRSDRGLRWVQAGQAEQGAGSTVALGAQCSHSSSQLISRAEGEKPAVGEKPAELRGIDGCIDCLGTTSPPSQRHGAGEGGQGVKQNPGPMTGCWQSGARGLEHHWPLARRHWGTQGQEGKGKTLAHCLPCAPHPSSPRAGSGQKSGQCLCHAGKMWGC